MLHRFGMGSKDVYSLNVVPVNYLDLNLITADCNPLFIWRESDIAYWQCEADKYSFKIVLVTFSYVIFAYGSVLCSEDGIVVLRKGQPPCYAVCQSLLTPQANANVSS